MDCITVYQSPIGEITLGSDGYSLTGLWFEGQKHFGGTLAQHYTHNDGLAVFADTRRWLDCYFSGGIPQHTPDILLTGTPFQLRVWKELQAIPYSRTVSYGYVAKAVGCASAQAVGGAVALNPVSIIVPCHRVVASNGALTGYAGGLERKEWLLRLERAGAGLFEKGVSY